MLKNQSLEKDIIATLAVMESQLTQSLEEQKGIRRDISALTTEISEIELKISSLEQSSASCDRQVVSSLSKLESEYSKIKTEIQDHKTWLLKHETLITKIEQEKQAREQIKQKVTAGILQYLAIAVIGIFGLGVSLYFTQSIQRPPTENR
jgi:chromosome segregation ATPase